MRVDVRYTTPKGIGYHQGYTTLEGYFSHFFQNTWVPFADVRGHVFDNGKLAANAGTGMRYVSQSRVWGASLYYDYRNAKRQHYNQISFDLETLGKIWDFRMNGYLLVGDRQSHLFGVAFDSFRKNHMYLRAYRNFALGGMDAELGAHVDPFFFGIGPYYLKGNKETTNGGKARFSVDLFNSYIRLEANVAYDHFFKWTGQGQVALNIPFGKSRKVKSNHCPPSDAEILYARAIQPIIRNEIIPEGKKSLRRVAVDPATKTPYYFIFVDNTSSSLGTYESPYPNLQDAQLASSPNSVIYVFPGNGDAYDTAYGTTAGMHFFCNFAVHKVSYS